MSLGGGRHWSGVWPGLPPIPGWPIPLGGLVRCWQPGGQDGGAPAVLRPCLRTLPAAIGPCQGPQQEVPQSLITARRECVHYYQYKCVCYECLWAGESYFYMWSGNKCYANIRDSGYWVKNQKQNVGAVHGITNPSSEIKIVIPIVKQSFHVMWSMTSLLIPNFTNAFIQKCPICDI